MNVAIACGGTGGHLFPGLAVAEALRARGHRTLLFISEKEIDALAVQGQAASEDFILEKLPSIGLPRLFSPAVFGFGRGLFASLLACRRIYQTFRPSAVLGMGGFTSTAPMLAGRLRGVPTFVHESNAIPGKANRLNARLAQVVLLGFAECARHFPPGTRCETTGTPIRGSLRRSVDRTAALRGFGFDPAAKDARTLLVMGGSQGARGINRAVTNALPAWKNAELRVIHLTGKDDEAHVRAAYAEQGISAHVAPFCHEMQLAYAAADLAIARSGAASLSELAACGLPAILVPYPFAAEDHQTRNAELFAAPGAGVLVKENEPEATETIGRTVAELLWENEEKRARMAQAMRALAPNDAAARVAAAIETLGEPAAAVARAQTAPLL